MLKETDVIEGKLYGKVYIFKLKQVVLSFNRYLLFSISSTLRALSCIRELHQNHNFLEIPVGTSVLTFMRIRTSKLSLQCGLSRGGQVGIIS